MAEKAEGRPEDQKGRRSSGYGTASVEEPAYGSGMRHPVLNSLEELSKKAGCNMEKLIKLKAWRKSLPQRECFPANGLPRLDSLTA